MQKINEIIFLLIVQLIIGSSITEAAPGRYTNFAFKFRKKYKWDYIEIFSY